MTNQVLIADGYAMFRHSVRNLVVAEGGHGEIVEASSGAALRRVVMSGQPTALSVVHPRSLGLGEGECMRLLGRLPGEGRAIVFRDQSVQATPDGLGRRVVVLSRDADCRLVAAAISGRPQGLARLADPEDGLALARSLSRRQRQIMAMVAEGCPNKEIAHRLDIAEGTVKAHIHAVFRTLGVSNRTQAVIRFGPALRAAG